jgi:hypothetical protein
MDLLKNNSWFNDDLINGYLDLVCNYWTDPQLVTNGIDLVILSSTILPYLDRFDRTEREQRFKDHFKRHVANSRKYLNINSTLVMVAVNENNKHWYLMTADTRTK